MKKTILVLTLFAFFSSELKAQTCTGTTLLTAASGSFSDGSGTAFYSNNLDCRWLIQPSSAGTIQLTFTAFETEDFIDSVFIYSGSTINAPLVAGFSGRTIPPTVRSSGATMLVRFKTDGSLGLQGWTANYTTQAAMCGNYTIGGSSPDYLTLADAITDVTARGVSCAVNFNIRAGFYQEQIVIGAIPGASLSNTVTFKSATGIRNSVVISKPLTATNNYTIKLNGAAYVNFTDLTLNNSQGRIVEISGASHNNRLATTQFDGPMIATPSNLYSIIYSPSTNDNNNIIERNVFNNGSSAIYFEGAATGGNEQGTIIRNNLFFNQYRSAMELRYQRNFLVSKNQISINSVNPTGTYGFYFYRCYGSSGARSTASNNFVVMQGNVVASGIRVEESEYVSVLYNSVNVISNKPASRALDHTGTIGGNVEIKNSSFYNSGTGYAISASPTANSSYDYNNLATAGNFVGNWNGIKSATLANWQTNSAKDPNSVSLVPGYLSSTDLHLVLTSPLNARATPLTVVFDDIDGDNRNASTPDIGADEVFATIFAISCPSNKVVPTDPNLCSANVSGLGATVVNGSGSTTVTNNFNNTNLANGVYPLGLTTVTYTANDNGNITNCTFTVTIQDQQAPVINNCPSNQNLFTSSSSCTANAVFATPTFTDNCPGGAITQIAGLTSGSAFPVGSNTISFRATDANNLASQCNFTISVSDPISPIFNNCPSNQLITGGGTNCSATVNYTTPTATDNCGATTQVQTQGPASGTVFTSGTTTVAFTAIDGSGNSALCSFTVTIVDNQNPNIICQGNVQNVAAQGVCSRSIIFNTPTATDNCPGVVTTLTAGLPSGSAFPVGNTTITFLATDAAGNSASCSFQIQVVDGQGPSISCPQNISVPGGPLCSAVANYTTPIAVDNCPGVVVTRTQGLASGAVFPGGINTVTFKATDATGNINNCSFTITVTDSQAPSIQCPAGITQNVAPGTCSVQVTYASPTANDNCSTPVVVRTSGNASGFNFGVGANVVTFRATDAAGNTANCTFTITVNDNIAPVIICPANVVVNATGLTCATTANYNNATATDNCPAVAVTNTSTIQSGSVFPIGTTLLTFRATDVSGNIATCSFTLRVVDNIMPTISCPASGTLNTSTTTCTAVFNYSVSGNDNCPNYAISQISGLASGTAFPVGNTTCNWRITDAGGNVANCSFTMTVFDKILPVMVCPANITVNTPSGQGSAIVNFNLPTATDNCPGNIAISQLSGPVSGSVFLPGINIVSFTATDASGNIAFCTTSITVISTTALAVNCPSNVTINNDAGRCDANVTSLAVTVIAGSGNEVVTNTFNGTGLANGRYPVGTTSVAYNVVDGAQTASCSFTVVVTDNEKPMIQCPVSNTFTTESTSCFKIVPYQVPVGADNCPNVATALTAGLASGSQFTIGQNNIVFTATDAAGNITSCGFTITVIDNVLPNINCPPNQTLLTSSNNCFAVAQYTVTGSDNCPGFTLIKQSGIASGAQFPVGVSSIAYTNTDASGNITNCNFSITVLDQISPVLICPQNIFISTLPGQTVATVNFPQPVATDNCTGNLTVIQITGSPSGAQFPTGTNVIRFQATDASGNNGFCTFNIFVNAINVLTINCPPDVAVSNTLTRCDALVTGLSPTVTGASGSQSVLNNFNNTSLADDTYIVGNTLVVYTVNDGAQSASCSFTVSVTDAELPQIVCPTNVVINTSASNCTAIANFTSATANDNCTGVVVAQSAGLFSGSPFPLGISTVSYKATDASGNTAVCSFTVQVVDNILPVINCPTNINTSTSPGLCTAVVTYSTPTASDNCNVASVNLIAGLTSGAVFAKGSNLVTYQAVDGSGNVRNCNFNIIVNDNQNPVINCQAATSVSTTTTQCSAIVTYAIPVAIDNCTGVVVSRFFGPASGASLPIGNTTVSFEATDASGNKSSCSFTITVVDLVLPTIACPQNVVSNTNTGLCLAVVNYAQITGSDNCAGVFVNQIAGLGSGRSFPVGTTTETYEAVDAANNKTSCSFTVTVLDSQAPIIICPQNIVATAQTGQTGVNVNYNAPTANDNCPGLQNVVLASGLSNGSFFPLGTTTQVYSVSDNSGNTSTCSFTVNVVQSNALIVNCPANVNVINDAGLCAANISGLVVSLINGSANAVIGNSYNSTADASGLYPVGTTNVLFTVVDGAQISTCSFTVLVRDAQAPSIACPANVVLGNDINTCAAVYNYNLPVASDNCAGTTTSRLSGLASGSAFSAGLNVVSLRAIDAAGNQSVCSFTITVNDTQKPTIICPASIVTNNTPGQSSAIVTYVLPQAQDNCVGLNTPVLTGIGSGNVFPAGISTEQFSVVDASGNVSSCSFTITVLQGNALSISCPVNVSISNDIGQCEAVLTGLSPVVLNGSANQVLLNTFNNTGNANDTYPVGSTNVVYTVNDGSNSASCSFTVKVVDVEVPTVNCPGNLVLNTPAGQASAFVTYISPSGSDNCPNATFGLISGYPTGTLFPIGLTTVAYRGTDFSGNVNDCSFTVRVIGTGVVISGNIRSELGSPVRSVRVQYSSIFGNQSVQTNRFGAYSFSVQGGTPATITPSKSNDTIRANGVDVLDVALIQAHIRGSRILSSPYKLIAADVTGETKISVLDVIYVQKFILGGFTIFPGNYLWRFVSSSYTFPNPTQPWGWAESRTYASTVPLSNQDFIGVKLGDINNTWDPNIAKMQVKGTFKVSIDKAKTDDAGNVHFAFSSKEFTSISGYQFTLSYDTDAYEFVEIQHDGALVYGENQLAKGKIGVLYTPGNQDARTFAEGEQLFDIVLKPKGKAGSFSLAIDESVVDVKAYDQEFELLEMVFDNNNIDLVANELELLNVSVQPNPFINSTTIALNANYVDQVSVTVLNMQGQILGVMNGSIAPGTTNLSWTPGAELPAGIYMLKIRGAKTAAEAKVILQR